MKVETLDIAKYDRMVRLLERIDRYWKANSTARSDSLYYELLAGYYGRLGRAREERKLVAAHTVLIPSEILLAMDIVPQDMEFGSNMLVLVIREYEEAFSAAKAFGFAPEICSAHRMLSGIYLKGWMPPPDMVIWTHLACDSTPKTPELLKELYGVPGFFLDRPYRHTPRAVTYYTREMEDLVSFLEELTQRQMDWDRLRETVELSRRMMEIHQEINELRKITPCPMANRRSFQMLVISHFYRGTQEGVAFYETVRDELREKAAAHHGAGAEERFRLLSLFIPPQRDMKLLDWMQREHGAIIVADPHQSHWGEWDIDSSHPLESLAQRSFVSPLVRQCHGPAEEGLIEDSVNDALSHGAEGAIYWAHIGCRQSCAMIRTVKDALMDRAGIPTLVVDMDITDPSFVPEEEIMEKLEGFFEILEDRR
jgi:benzoyl-CoA reductase/2-hydroxyglutaryl-CoA dehydratase subunit BcrC/BadD/HgdB